MLNLQVSRAYCVFKTAWKVMSKKTILWIEPPEYIFWYLWLPRDIYYTYFFICFEIWISLAIDFIWTYETLAILRPISIIFLFLKQPGPETRLGDGWSSFGKEVAVSTHMRCFVKQTRHQPSMIGLLFGERLPCKWVIIKCQCFM